MEAEKTTSTQEREEIQIKEVRRGVRQNVSKMFKDVNAILEQKKKKKELQEKTRGKVVNFELITYDQEFESINIIKPEFKIAIPEDEPYFEAETNQKVFGEVTIRYCSGARSIFKHLQPEDAKITHIVFDSPIKSLNTNYDKKLIEFMSIAPVCESSPYARPEYSFVYRKMSGSRKEDENVKEINDAVTKVNKASETEVFVAAVNLGIDYLEYSDIQSLRTQLVSMALKDPAKVVKEIETPDEQLFIFKMAIDDGGIVQREGMYYETKTNKPMFPVVHADTLDQMLNKFFKDPTNKGIVEWLYEKYGL